MSRQTRYITSPIYYVNAKPHIGHAYTNILCDTFSRYYRFLGEKTFFITGTDEHGAKMEKTAKEKNMDPKAYADLISPTFKELWRLLGIRYDYFIRTTDDYHKQVVCNILKRLEAKGDIYPSSYTGWYCVPCETFWTKLQLIDGKCPECRREVQELSEDNYFFRLSKYQDWLIQYIEDHPAFIRPDFRRNEILSFLKQPLEDLCITRSKKRLSWGIEYPNSKDHVVYVWFDALINYLSGIGYTTDEKKFETYWPADIQLIGKDILRHHAIYWPIMLKACDVEPPVVILAHGWWTVSGAKMSKTAGNVVDPLELVKIYGVDAFRYFLLREVTVGHDGAFSEELLKERYTSDLANDLGNLWFRFASMLGKYFHGTIPKVPVKIMGSKLMQETFLTWDRVRESMECYDPREALSAIFRVITLANQYVEEQKPWVLAKDKKQNEKLAQVLVILGECLAHLAVLLQSFLPDSSKKILDRLKITGMEIIPHKEDFEKRMIRTDTGIERGEVLFPRLDEKKTD
ncbi:MAG: methionine--tRNA ligase [Candidatus Omnitrophica bacterium]|nr:methionine--tRNA ligase [Candidatus Omnitrophota bacterium]